MSQALTVTFDLDDGTNTVSKVQAGQGEKISKPSDPTRTGYVFDGWYTDNTAYTTPWNFSTGTVPADITLYAKWTQLFTVSFMLNDGTSTTPLDTVQAAQGHTISAPSTAPYRAGYSFEGWYKDAACTTPWDFSADTVSGNTTLYAKWAFKVESESDWNIAKTAITNGGANKSYVINVAADFSMAGTTGSTFGSVTGLSVTIKGNHAITLSGTGYLLFVNSNQTVVIQDTDLIGYASNNATLVVIQQGGSLTMQGSASVSGNNVTSATSGSGGGVYVAGTFTMKESASVFGNTRNSGGAGVYVILNGTFTMQGSATVYGNTTTNDNGGGVYGSNGTFTMRDSASVSGNTASGNGGGVCGLSGSFRMAGGTVYGSDGSTDANTATGNGAALFINGIPATYGPDGTGTDIPYLIAGAGSSKYTNNTIKVVGGVLQ
jgi:uncharacterized repeat protein (TIGR02543 family)